MAGRTAYSPTKYAALNLLLARWARKVAAPGGHRYVTLGGTELKDLSILTFIDRELASGALSIECDDGRFWMASETAKRLREDHQVSVEVLQGEFFEYRRESDEPHLFFLDLEGIFAWGRYPQLLGRFLANATLGEGDTFVVTSYLGRHPGWQRVFSTYEAQFGMLGASSESAKRDYYKWAHPTFTLFQALETEGLSGELLVCCIGCVWYRGTSPMGVWAYSFDEGRTRFTDLVHSGWSNRFDVNRGLVSYPAGA